MSRKHISEKNYSFPPEIPGTSKAPRKLEVKFQEQYNNTNKCQKPGPKGARLFLFPFIHYSLSSPWRLKQASYVPFVAQHSYCAGSRET